MMGCILLLFWDWPLLELKQPQRNWILARSVEAHRHRHDEEDNKIEAAGEPFHLPVSFRVDFIGEPVDERHDLSCSGIVAKWEPREGTEGRPVHDLSRLGYELREVG